MNYYAPAPQPPPQSPRWVPYAIGVAVGVLVLALGIGGVVLLASGRDGGRSASAATDSGAVTVTATATSPVTVTAAASPQAASTIDRTGNSEGVAIRAGGASCQVYRGLVYCGISGRSVRREHLGVVTVGLAGCGGSSSVVGTAPGGSFLQWSNTDDACAVVGVNAPPSTEVLNPDPGEVVALSVTGVRLACTAVADGINCYKSPTDHFEISSGRVDITGA
ncbi:MAG: hypothetical protein QM662_04710 [Gordonia sp. (in: high G+C Gram-positive bacteria)]